MTGEEENGVGGVVSQVQDIPWTEVSAVVIALCALFFTGWQAWITRKHNKLSVKPHLIRHTNLNKFPNHCELSVSLKNIGLGPLFVKKMVFYHNGEPFDFHDDDELEAKIWGIVGHKDFNHSSGTINNGSGLEPGSEHQIFRLEFSRTFPEQCIQAAKDLDAFDVVVEYESIYGDKFTHDSRTDDGNG